MTDWFRSWHGAPTDPKWLGIAKRAGVAPGIAVSVAWALMDRASQAEDRGSIAGYDADGLGCFFGCEPEQVESIVIAMADKGMIVDGRFASWEKRQPRREDPSYERVKAFRERVKRGETQSNAPDTDTDTDRSDANASDADASDDDFPPDAFQVWYALYPHKIGRSAAEKAFLRVRKGKKVAFSQLVEGLRRYIRTKPPDRAWCNPATWLNQDRWADQPGNVEPLFQHGHQANAGKTRTVHDAAAALAKWVRDEDERGQRPMLQIGSG